MRNYVVPLLGVVVFTVALSACSVFVGRGVPQVPRVQGATLEDVTKRYVPHLRQPAFSDVRIHGTRATPHGVLVLYTAQTATPSEPPYPPMIGYALTQQHGSVWQVTASGMSGSGAEPNQFVEYATSPFPGDNGHIEMVYGRVIDPQITAVQATFDTGQIMHDHVTGEMFSLMAANATTVCEVRFLDAHGNIIQRLDPTQSRTAPPDMHERAAHCVTQ